MTGDERDEQGVESAALSDGELDELLGAYALDAVDEDERRAVEAYLVVNPRARAEVAEHREVASLLAWSGAAAPDGLWDRIAANLDEPAPTPRGELAAVLALDPNRRPQDGGSASATPQDALGPRRLLGRHRCCGSARRSARRDGR